ncbi:MAG: RimK family alpha-L-glutamate ligase [Vicinamibacterales bacterium]
MQSAALIFATCVSLPGITPDDQPLADALMSLGVEVRPLPWTEIAPDASLPVLLRSTWDYYLSGPRFEGWLQALEAAGTRVINPAPVARWNMDKRYLLELEAAGVAIPPTLMAHGFDGAGLRTALEARGWSTAVVKPRVSATAHGTLVVRAGEAIPEAGLEPASNAGALIQAFVPEILEQGELSLVYLGGQYSHAVRKRARPSDFRVQSDHGGTVEAASPSAASRALGDRAVSAAPGSCLYARVDLVETSRGPVLMELELIEPELFFLHAPAAAMQCARLLRSMLAS